MDIFQVHEITAVRTEPTSSLGRDGAMVSMQYVQQGRGRIRRPCPRLEAAALVGSTLRSIDAASASRWSHPRFLPAVMQLHSFGSQLRLQENLFERTR